MSFLARCPQCVFVTRQIGQFTPCLLHVDVDAQPEVQVDVSYDEPYVFGQVRPSVDRPGPFTLREYVRLALLRSRLQDALQHTSGSRTGNDVSMLVQGTAL
jgi:hypothetical protein